MANQDFSETLSLVLRLWACLPRHRKKLSAYLLGLMSIGASTEVFSIATVIPFLLILSNPGQAFSNPVYQPLIHTLHIQSDHDFLLPISLLFCFSAFLVCLIRTLSSFFNVRLSSAIGSDISSESYRRTLCQPYLYHISRNSSLLLATITTDVNQLIYGVVNPLITTLSSLVVSLAIITALVYVNPLVALSIGFTVITVYLLLSVSTRVPISHLSKEQALLNRNLINSLQEGLGGIREIIIDSSQDYYYHSYVQSDRPLRRS